MIDNELLRKAESGDVDSIIDIALAYTYGEEGEDNIDKSYYWFSRALEIEPENVRAINGLGNCYYYGDGVAKDELKGVQLYRKAAEMDGMGGQYNLAKHLEKEKNPECMEWFQKVSDAGDEDAPFDMACIFYDGEIVPQDIKLAFHNLRLASERGNTYAMTRLGVEYLQGRHIEKDPSKAFELFNKAYESGNGLAARQMAIAYLNGFGVEPDITKFIEWGEKAADLGEDDKSSVYYAAASQYQKDKSYDGLMNSAEWYKKSADLGNVNGVMSTCTSYAVIALLHQNKTIGAWKDAIDAWEIVYDYAKKLLEDYYPTGEYNISPDDYHTMVFNVQESIYNRAICYYYLHDYSSAIRMLSDPECPNKTKQKVLLGACLFQADSSFKESISYLKLSENQDYIKEEKTAEEDFVYASASVILSGFYRLEGDMKHAVEILDQAYASIKDKDCRETIIAAERKRYVKKLLSFKYIEK